MRGGKVKHGAAKNGAETSEYRIWCAMRERCSRPRNREYHRYGGRGIRVCDRWQQFENFISDMGLKPSPTHSIDRKDVNGNYEPSNCKWATPVEQNRNKRNSIILSHRGETMHVLEWSKRLGLSMHTIRMRLRHTRDAALVLRPSRQTGEKP